jgi:hypothetical protein
VVALDDTTIMVVGGIQGAEYSAKTFIYNTLLQVIFETPGIFLILISLKLLSRTQGPSKNYRKNSGNHG